MGFSYVPSLPADKDRVRFLIRDTNPAAPLFDDGEIAWLLGENPNVYLAAAACCDILANAGGGGGNGAVVRKKVGDVEIQYDAMSYQGLGAQLRARGRRAGAMPFAGGLSVAGKLTSQQDADLVQPLFTRDQFRPPGSSSEAAR